MWPNLRYIANMDRFRTTAHMRKPWRLLLGLLCVGLVLLMGTMAATHTHMDRADHPDCGLCVTAHMAVKLASPAVQVVKTPVIQRVEPAHSVVWVRTVSRFALFTRPPPQEEA
jgi:hypothetical protein